MEITIKRILKDIKTLHNSNLHDLNIFFNTDDNNIFNLQVMIIGPNDTPYNFGFYLFDITFPQNYPFSPPHIKFYTQGLNIRLNPNLYVNGKVCLSLLNTWTGPQWTSCNTILSIILSIQSMILINNPLNNEPGYTNDNSITSINYQHIIEYANYKIAIINMINDPPLKFICFQQNMIDKFKENYTYIINHIQILINKYPKTSKNIICRVYSMNIYCNFNTLLTDINSLYTQLNSKNTRTLNNSTSQ